MRSFRFGPFVLVPEQQLLSRGETRVAIGSRALDILTALVERPGELLSKTELIARVWPSTTVEEGNLKVNVAVLRRTLGESSRYIATVTGRGYRFVEPVQVTLAPDATPATSALHNLPAALTRIIGRAADVDAVLTKLREQRWLTLVGAGGIGKTAVALEAARRAVVSFAHGVWFVDLAFVTEASLVPSTVAAALGLRVHSDDLMAALRAFLRERVLLLVLDNCEHLIDSVVAVAGQLLAAAPDVRVLATSRAPLRARGEWVYRLPPLAAPEPSPQLTAAAALMFPAVELFVERASASVSDFRLLDADAALVAEICRRLEGLALAIELTATRVDAFSLRELLELLDDRLRFLHAGPSAPERQHTLTATLDWSYHLLPERESSLLRRLAVFAGPFSLESARAVSSDEVALELANVVAKSLVAREAGGLVTHYRLLDTTRSYTLQKLSESGELERLRQLHAEHVRELAERAEAEWGVRPTAEWLECYGRKVDDVRSALTWAFGRSERAAIGVALTVAAIPLWEHLSLVEECRAGVERALAQPLRSEREEMKLSMALATTLLHTRGPLPRVASTWTTSLQLAEKLGDSDYQLRSLWGLCDYHTWIGEHRTALTLTDRIREIAQAKGDAATCTNVDRQVGTALRYLGELVDARVRLEHMIASYVPPVVRSDIARFQLDPRAAARGTLANVLWLQGRPDQARATVERQLEDARAADHALALCNALVHAACPLALWGGDLDQAERLLALSEDHVAKHAMPIWGAMVQCLRGEWLLQRGDVLGTHVLRGALDQLLAAGFCMRAPMHLGVLAAGLNSHGEHDAAQRTINEAIALSQRNGELWCLPELLRIRGSLLRSGAELMQALEQARRQGALSFELRAAIDLVQLHQGERAGASARQLLAASYERFDQGFETRDLRRARALLKGSTALV